MKRSTLILILVLSLSPLNLLAKPLNLDAIKLKGQEYYKTYRVSSSKGFQRISNKMNGFRFFQGGGQYGEAFYLFTKIKDARRFAKIENTRGTHRNVISEVLLPKKMFETVKKAEIKPALDWAVNKPRTSNENQKMRDIRNSNHLVYGKWADSPSINEPAYKPMNGSEQIGVVQRGMPSILQKAVIRKLESVD